MRWFLLWPHELQIRGGAYSVPESMWSGSYHWTKKARTR